MVIEQIYLKGLIKGSYKDFTKLYELYASRLYAFVISLSHSDTIAREVVQETFIKVWTQREQIDPQLSFKSYLFTIARNRLLNEFRNRLVHPLFIEELDPALKENLGENPVESELFLEEFQQALDKAKEKLTPRQRMLFELYKEEGVSIPEIAGRISISEQSVRNQISHALQRLRKEMGHFYSLFLLFFL